MGRKKEISQFGRGQVIGQLKAGNHIAECLNILKRLQMRCVYDNCKIEVNWVKTCTFQIRLAYNKNNPNSSFVKRIVTTDSRDSTIDITSKLAESITPTV